MDDRINGYESLVCRIAKRYRAPQGQEAVWTQDAIQQEGRIGVWNALRRYDPEGLHRGYSENTIVGFGIKTQIRKALRLANGGHDVSEVEEPAPDIADQPTMPLPLPIRTPAWMQDRITRPLPTLSPIELTEMTPDPAPSVEEQVAARLDGLQVNATLEAALLLLSERQRTIIERRYGLSGDGIPWTCEEVGKLLGIHKSNVSRAQHKALATLRAHLSATRDGELVLIQLDARRSRRARTRAAA